MVQVDRDSSSSKVARVVPMVVYDINHARTVAFAVQVVHGGYRRAYHLSNFPELMHCQRKQGLVVQKTRDVFSGDVDVQILRLSKRPYTQEELEAYYSGFEDFEIRQLRECGPNGTSQRRFNAFGWTSDGGLQVILREAFFDEATEFERIGIGTIVRCLPVEATSIQKRKGYATDKGAFARVTHY